MIFLNIIVSVKKFTFRVYGKYGILYTDVREIRRRLPAFLPVCKMYVKCIRFNGQTTKVPKKCLFDRAICDIISKLAKCRRLRVCRIAKRR